MKKSVVILSLTLAVASVATASATYMSSNSKQHALEKVTRMENLSMVAVKNGDYELACRAQTQIVDTLNKIPLKGQDLIGSAFEQKQDFCTKAATSAMNEYRFFN